MIHTTRARGLAMTMVGGLVFGLSGLTHPTHAAANASHDTVVAELRARAAVAQAAATAVGGHTMRFVSAADPDERACIAVDQVTNVAAVRRIASPGCGVDVLVATATTVYSRMTGEGAFGQRLRPDPAALRLLGRPGARWVSTPVRGTSPAPDVASEFAIDAMIDSALLDVEVITAAEVTPTLITITGHPRRQSARRSTQRFTFSGDQLTRVVTTGADASNVTFDYARPSLTVPPARRVVPMQQYSDAAAVTGAVRQARHAAPKLRRAVIRRAQGVAPVTALRRAVDNWVESVGTFPSFTGIGSTPGGAVVTTRNRFGRVAVALTWLPNPRKVRVEVRHKEIHRPS